MRRTCAATTVAAETVAVEAVAIETATVVAAFFNHLRFTFSSPADANLSKRL